jgi:hypothetical protein
VVSFSKSGFDFRICKIKIFGPLETRGKIFYGMGTLGYKR